MYDRSFVKADGAGGEISGPEAAHILSYAGIPQVPCQRTEGGVGEEAGVGVGVGAGIGGAACSGLVT